MTQLEYMSTLMSECLCAYPPILKIPQVAEVLKEDVPTIRARIRRGTFQITVRQEEGNPQYVLLTDLVRFLCTGEVQPQPIARPCRVPRNPLGLNGKRKRGAPTKSERLARKKAEGKTE